MEFRRIQWLAVLLPALSVGLFEHIRHSWLEPKLPPALGNLVGPLVVAAAVYGFVRIFTGIVERSALEAARARSEAAVILERQRIARDMHDHVAQALFYLTVKLRDVAARVAAGETDRARRELQVMEQHLKETYRQVRTVISDLKQQAALEDFGSAVRRTVREQAERTGLHVDCQIADLPAMPAAAQQHLLAIIQEALTNARRHGQARRATVQVRADGGAVTVTITDDGRGFDPRAVAGAGHGLTIMAERARMAGGDLQVDAAPGRGTRISVRTGEAEP